MDAQIKVIDGDQTRELAALAQWLRRSREFQGRVVLAASPPRDGELGGAFELLTVALGSSGMGAALVQMLGSWAQSRRSDVKIHVTIGDRSAEIQVGHTRDLAQAEEAVRRLMAHGDED
ncbi:effector-associated constant component EACC1 [Kitasatospora kifunensis]|uniref:Uncharacterized protein n=1 Tax=Kitasatospora kifunensis TaxID=58351 RepID=A0A7W7VTT5_KITKI|nr:hypothetical protein [Kitasatospora kifunensis]MBB4921959.1 hypothetical protein [Kitasatospora kifunensis]